MIEIFDYYVHERFVRSIQVETVLVFHYLPLDGFSHLACHYFAGLDAHIEQLFELSE